MNTRLKYFTTVLVAGAFKVIYRERCLELLTVCLRRVCTATLQLIRDAHFRTRTRFAFVVYNVIRVRGGCPSNVDVLTRNPDILVPFLSFGIRLYLYTKTRNTRAAQCSAFFWYNLFFSLFK